jgi:hypothetical protein
VDGQGFPTAMANPEVKHKETPINTIYRRMIQKKCRNKSRITLTAGDKTIILVFK